MPVRFLYPSPLSLPVVLLLWLACLGEAKFVELTFHVTEHSEANKLIGNVLQGIALSRQEVRSISVESPPPEEWITYVHINTTTGDIYTSGESPTTLDREVICPLRVVGEVIQECQFSLLISINQKYLVSLHLIIDDINDSPPLFFHHGQVIKELVLSLPESAAIGETALDLPTAVDPDLKSSLSPITYHLIGENLPFYLLSRGGAPKLYLSAPLDFESVPLYKFFLQALDERSGRIFLRAPQLEPKRYSFVIEATEGVNSTSPVSKSATALVAIFVADVNNHRPIIELKPFSNASTLAYATIREEFVVEHQEEVMDPTVLAYLTVTDKDEGSNALCTCRLDESPLTRAFELTKVNQLSPQMNVYRLIAIKSLDAEDAVVLRHLIQPVEADRCKGVAGFLVLKITCADSGNTPLETQATVYIALRDVDEYPTKFVFPDSTEVYRISVKEDVKVGTKLMDLVVDDVDTGKCIQMSTSLKNEQIFLESDSGTLVLRSPLDYETTASILFTVSAGERRIHPRGQPSATATVILEIINVNDNQPRLTALKAVESKMCQKMISSINDSINQTIDCFVLEVEEEVEIGFRIHHLVAIDADTPNTTSGFIFSLAGAYAPVKPHKVEKLKVSPLEVTKKGDLLVTGRLDREQFNWMDLLISVSDGEESSVSLLRVNLVDINDNQPVWQFPSPTDYHISVSLFARVDVIVSRVQALDADFGALNGGVEYKILPQPKDIIASGLLLEHLTHSLYGSHLFSINPLTGKLSVKQALPNQTAVPYRLDLIAVDKGKPTLESTAHLLISLVDRPFNDVQMIQANPVGGSNNLQNDGVDTIQASSLNSVVEHSGVRSTPSSMENRIHIIGISAGVLTLFFFLAVISFVLCKRVQSGSLSLCRKSSNSLELQSNQRHSWSPSMASPVHEVLLERRDPVILSTQPPSPPPLPPSLPPAVPPPSSPPLSVVEIPTCSIAFSGATSSPMEMSSVKNVPVIVSVAVLPPSSSTPTEYVVISEGVTVTPSKYSWKVVNDSDYIITER
ncbi:Protocadherin gamma-A9 [Echinococcus granulosus]|uniref:Protocadherin gamma-A9 n=1 Tax=Echinococcus granulosus TaxID=6210 RepID=W6UFA0_ECHGR|nr:Protocadherin gamma-A9 [Echinococcus granulosus]EUB59783.1 Protocadherin gamma-A9 [Echinococcus granulosus]